ncbi:MAG: exodeoxyribonuclease VII large subunit [Halobacteriovoraceae bacterium]|nr:exodeoxyribonuclease VII large subunit [Halobacteriovoraceae bacterium]|tara:strand:- start:643 stop:1905 length:1263 start_codon:yes stop_codon:yes gene_type:complete
MSISQPLEVRDIIHAIKTSLEFEFSQISVIGEVTNLSSSKTGHFYFTLSDSDASLSCALFRGDALRNPLVKGLKDGDKIIVSGPINVYAKRGNFQLIAKTLSKAGKGDLKLQFEKLKQKLLAEGLFEQEHKKIIPSFPKRIGVITAAGGAAVHDFVNIVRRRSLWCDILVIPSLVQGDSAPRSLIKALNWADKNEEVDLIILTRGGGSLEDLWAFNDESLAREIFKSRTPIISAVGHQVDFSLSDFVADLRLETPSAAAEFITEPQTKISQKLNHLTRSLGQQFGSFKARVLEKIEKVNPKNLTYLLEQKISSQKQRVSRINFSYLENQLRLADKTLYSEDLIQRGQEVVEKRIEKSQNKLELLTRALTGLGPENVLRRGYSYVASGKSIITSQKEFDKLSKETELRIHFYDGKGLVRKS